MLRLSLALAVLFSLQASPAPAQLDPELSKPYELEVVLDVARHRLLTDVFKQKVQDELEDGLQAALGKLANVKVTDQHPRLADVRERGLKVLDEWKELTGKKTQFVLIDYVKGRYELRSRQHDGLTGQASPVVRRAGTSDRPFVARLATLLIDRDFGIVGTLAKGADPKQIVKISINGWKLSKNLDHWVKESEIFQIVPIYVGRSEAYPIPNAVLQVLSGPDGKGECRCRLHHRYLDPLADAPGLLGYRCLKLGTLRNAPLKLRFVQRGPNNAIYPATDLRLEIRDKVDAKPGETIVSDTDLEGYFSSQENEKGRFDNLVFVTARLSGGRSAFIPVPLVSDDPVLIGVAAQQPGARSTLTIRINSWEKRALDYDQLLAQVFRKLSNLGADAAVVQAGVQQAEQQLKQSEEALRKLQQDRERLAEKILAPDKPMELLQDGDRHLANLAKGHEKLRAYVVGQKKILNSGDNKQQQQWLQHVAKAKQEESQSNYDAALAIYDTVIQEGLKDPAIIKHRDELRKQWMIKNEAHGKARRFIYDVWPSLDTAEKLKLHVKDVETAVEACVANKDELTALKFLQVADQHVAKLKALEKTLRADILQGDVETAKLILEVLTKLRPLILKANDVVQ